MYRKLWFNIRIWYVIFISHPFRLELLMEGETLKISYDGKVSSQFTEMSSSPRVEKGTSYVPKSYLS